MTYCFRYYDNDATCKHDDNIYYTNGDNLELIMMINIHITTTHILTLYAQSAY